MNKNKIYLAELTPFRGCWCSDAADDGGGDIGGEGGGGCDGDDSGDQVVGGGDGGGCGDRIKKNCSAWPQVKS